VPTVVIVGKGLANGVVEVRDRLAGSQDEVPVAAAAEAIVRLTR
jgi:prolyl-tRNA synthetase